MCKKPLSTRGLAALALAATLIGTLLAPGAAQAMASLNVVYVGGRSFRTGGTLTPPAGLYNLYDLAPAAVTDVSVLAPYDTVILNMNGTQIAGNLNNLPPAARTALVNFVTSGGKLLIYDSEASAQNYSWLPYPFTTNNPGARGAHGTLHVLGDTTLASNVSTSPYYINAPYLSNSTDAVGDMNVMTTMDSHWYASMSGTNVNNVTGPVQAYARLGSGLIIYDGLDWDASGNANLMKVFYQELGQRWNPDGLPGDIAVIGITLTPSGVSLAPGINHTLTANLTDLLGQPQAGVAVTFHVTAGPNTGATTVLTTNAQGDAYLTYTSAALGTDTVEASFVNGVQTRSVTATVNWISPMPGTAVRGWYTNGDGREANLAVNVRYAGTLLARTQFAVRAVNLNFASTVTTTYFLDLSKGKSTLRGVGTVNGVGGYAFLVTTIDGQAPGGGGVDKARIKIWNQATGGVVYDDQPGAGDNADPTAAVSGGITLY